MGARADSSDTDFSATTLTKLLGPPLPEGTRWRNMSIQNCGSVSVSLSFSEVDADEMIVPGNASETLPNDRGIVGVWAKRTAVGSGQLIINVTG